MSEPSPSALAPLVERAVQLAERWAAEAASAETKAEETRLAELLHDPSGRRFALDIADGVMRPESLAAAAVQLRRSAPVVPSALPWYVRGAVRWGGGAAPILPAPIVPIARRMLREVLRPLVADGRPAKLGAELERLAAPGVSLNLSLLGAKVLGDAEATRRLEGVRDLILRDDVEHVSLSVSAVIGQASEWAFDALVAQSADRLLPLYEAASSGNTAITLEVQEHRELDLTIAVFTRLLEDPRLTGLAAGIALPSSLPDALPALQELTAWVQDRVAHGGAPITVRLTKGANLALERADSALHGWIPASYDSPLDADANRLRCLDWALRPEHTAAVRIGVSGDDLGVAAYAWLLAQDRDVTAAVQFDMVHGYQAGRIRALARETGNVMRRVAVVAPADFDVAIGSILRLLDEEAPSDAAADVLRAALRRSSEPSLRIGARRTQDRLAPVHESVRPVVQTPRPEEQLTQAVLGIIRGSDDESFFETAVYSALEIEAGAGGAPGFENTPDSDPALPANREWAQGIFPRITAASADATPAPQSTADVDALLRRARDGHDGWASRPASERAEILLRAAAALDGGRGSLIEVAASETGLLFADADADVSRAVDCARYYAATARELDAISGAAFVPSDVVVVLSSWRAPLAEPADGVLAALAAGSTVVLAADPRARRSAEAVAETLWQVGVPRDALVIADGGLHQDLVAHEAVGLVVLHGSREVVDRVRTWRPGLPVLAEAEGAGAMIVTASADLDLAASDVVRSAFARAGQASRAVKVVILVGSAGRSKRFARQLADATRSLRVGQPDDPRTQVGPMIEKPQGAAERALTELDDDEQWLVQPRLETADPSGRLWSPGIRIGVRPGSRFLAEDHAVPVVGIMHAPTLEKAIELHDEVAAGIAAGLHTRDPEQLATWLDAVEAGSLFVNRSTVGTKVQRQPDGGWARSSTGPGAKSGGPNRLIGFGSWHAQRSTTLSSTLHLRGLDSRITALIEAAQPSLDFEEFEWLRRAALSDALAWDREFGQVRDVSKLGIERNLLRYRPVPVEVRVAADARLQDLLRVAIAAVRAGSPFVLSLAEGLPAGVRHALAELRATVYLESDAEWLQRGLRFGASEGDGELAGQPSARRVRLVGGADAVAGLRATLIETLGAGADISIHDGEVTSAGRIELLCFVREQSISITAHRGGVPDDWSSEVI